MRTNTNRTGRLGFDRLVDVYDANRPPVPELVVTEVRRMTGLGAGAPVLEIGAGTGQLTFPLRRAGLSVTALEPGAALAARLREHAAGDDELAVEVGLFEDHPAVDASHDAVWSAKGRACRWCWLSERRSRARSGKAEEGGRAGFSVDRRQRRRS